LAVTFGGLALTYVLVCIQIEGQAYPFTGGVKVFSSTIAWLQWLGYN